MTRKIRTAVLISGRGSNMVALAKAAKDANFPAEIVLVVSNRPDAAGLDKARELGLQTVAVDHKSYKSRLDFDKKLHAVLEDAQVELVCCAGFMRVLTGWLTSKWTGRMINIHPSLLPKYKGLHTHERALENGDKTHGCTVHYVSEELDGGDIILQSEIKIEHNDTPESLSSRLIPIEHELFIRALKQVAHKLGTEKNHT